jgi:hypothetical protein
MWLVVRNRMRWEVEEATPSRALRRPEKVTLPLNLVAPEKATISAARAERWRASVPSFAALRTASESSVDVLEKNDTSFGRVSEEMIELVVGKASFRQI